MSGGSALERRYGRLLSCYPAAHRRQHEQEMLGVLMTDARPGQRRPGLAESADLIWGALRVRLRPGLDSAADPGWRDTLAVLSVVLPLTALLVYAGSEATAFSLTLEPDGAGSLLLYPAASLAVPLLLTALVLLRLRRTAALATAGLMIAITAASLIQAGVIGLGNALEAAAFAGFVLVLELAALLASPGPRRGLQILSRRYRMLVAAVAAAVGAATGLSTPHPGWRLPAAALVATIAIGMAVASPLSRRLLVLLAIPFCSTTLVFVLSSQLPAPVSGAVACLPSVVISCLVIVAIRRSARTQAAATAKDSAERD